MATIIDALVLTLGLDPSDYEKGRKKVDSSADKMSDNLVKRLKGVESETKKTSAVFSELRSDVLALMAVFLGGRGLEEFIKDIGFADAAMARTAKTVNMSVGELAQWKGAADLAGGSGENLIGTLQGLADQYNQWQLTGESSIAPALRALQTINPKLQLDKNGQMADLGQFLLQLSDTVKNMPAPRARSLLQMLGIDGDTINVILQGRAALTAYLAESKKLQGNVAASAAEGKKLQQAYTEVGLAADGAGRALLIGIAPALVDVLHLLRDFGMWAQQHPKVLEAAFWAIATAVLVLSAALTVNLTRMALFQTAGAIRIVVGLLAKLFYWLGLLTVESLPALGEAFWGVGAAMEATPIGWMLTGIAALAYLADQLYEHWHEIPGWWHDMWVQMGSDVDEAWAKLHPDAPIGEMLQHRVGHDPDGTAVTIDATKGRDGFTRQGAPGAQSAAPAPAPNMAALAALFGGAAPSGGAGGLPGEDEVQAMIHKLAPGARITGGARDWATNLRVGGVPNSMHLKGQATDFVLPKGISFAQFKAMLDASGFHYTELLNESQIGGQGAHVHLGWGQKGGRHINVPRGSGRTPVAGGGNTTIHHDTRVGTLIVHSRAADAAGIAKDVKRELETNSHATQANTGLS